MSEKATQPTLSLQCSEYFVQKRFDGRIGNFHRNMAFHRKRNKNEMRFIISHMEGEDLVIVVDGVVVTKWAKTFGISAHVRWILVAKCFESLARVQIKWRTQQPCSVLDLQQAITEHKSFELFKVSSWNLFILHVLCVCVCDWHSGRRILPLLQLALFSLPTIFDFISLASNVKWVISRSHANISSSQRTYPSLSFVDAKCNNVICTHRHKIL